MSWQALLFYRWLGITAHHSRGMQARGEHIARMRGVLTHAHQGHTPITPRGVDFFNYFNFLIDTVFILPIACKFTRLCLFSMLDSCEECYSICPGSGSGGGGELTQLVRAWGM